MTAFKNTILALPAYGGGDYEGMSFAVVTVSPGLAQGLLDLMGQVRTLKLLQKPVYQVEAFDYTAQWYDDDVGELSEVIGKVAVLLLQRGVSAVLRKVPEGEPVRTECDTVMVREDAVAWSCYRKHGDLLFTTGSVGRAELEEIAAGKPLPRVKL